MKNILLGLSFTLFAIPTFAQTRPEIAFASVNTPYGIFGCKQRAQNKLYSIGATNVRDGSSNLTVISANYNNTTAVVWCRGTEAIIMTSGNDYIQLRDEIKFAF